MSDMTTEKLRECHIEGKWCVDLRCNRCYSAEVSVRGRQHWSEVFRIVSGALAGDAKKVRVYALFLADKIEADGDESTAARLRKIANGDGGAVVRPTVQPEGEVVLSGLVEASEQHDYGECSIRIESTTAATANGKRFQWLRYNAERPVVQVGARIVVRVEK